MVFKHGLNKPDQVSCPSLSIAFIYFRLIKLSKKEDYLCQKTSPEISANIVAPYLAEPCSFSCKIFTFCMFSRKIEKLFSLSVKNTLKS